LLGLDLSRSLDDAGFQRLHRTFGDHDALVVRDQRI
jgi:taurine dioxygenase